MDNISSIKLLNSILNISTTFNGFIHVGNEVEVLGLDNFKMSKTLKNKYIYYHNCFGRDSILEGNEYKFLTLNLKSFGNLAQKYDLKITFFYLIDLF